MLKTCKRSGTPLFKWGATSVSEQRRSPDFVTRSPQSPDMHAATCTRSRPKWRSKISTRSAGDVIVAAMALPQWGSGPSLVSRHRLIHSQAIARQRAVSAFTIEPDFRKRAIRVASQPSRRPRRVRFPSIAFELWHRSGAIDKARLLQALVRCAQLIAGRMNRRGVEEPHHRHRQLLRARRERPRRHAA